MSMIKHGIWVRAENWLLQQLILFDCLSIIKQNDFQVSIYINPTDT